MNSNFDASKGVQVVEQRLADLDNVPDARTVFTYEGAVPLRVEVDKATVRGRKQQGPYVGSVSWGSRQGLTLEESEDFAHKLLAAIAMARADLARRNDGHADR